MKPQEVFRLRTRSSSISRSGERPKNDRFYVSCSPFIKCLCKPGWVTWIWDISWRCKITDFWWWKWPKDVKYSSIKQLISRWSCQSPVPSPLRNCKQMSTIFTYYIQSPTVLDVVALENTNRLSINMVIMCACIVQDVVFSCVLFTSSFKIYKFPIIAKLP